MSTSFYTHLQVAAKQLESNWTLWPGSDLPTSQEIGDFVKFCDEPAHKFNALKEAYYAWKQ